MSRRRSHPRFGVDHRTGIRGFPDVAQAFRWGYFAGMWIEVGCRGRVRRQLTIRANARRLDVGACAAGVGQDPAPVGRRAVPPHRAGPSRLHRVPPPADTRSPFISHGGVAGRASPWLTSAGRPDRLARWARKPRRAQCSYTTSRRDATARQPRDLLHVGVQIPLSGDDSPRRDGLRSLSATTPCRRLPVEYARETEVSSSATASARAGRTGRLVSRPQPGDLILFGTSHVGIGQSVNPDRSLTTVEGNASSAVSVEQHSPSEATGFVRL